MRRPPRWYWPTVIVLVLVIVWFSWQDASMCQQVSCYR